MKNSEDKTYYGQTTNYNSQGTVSTATVVSERKLAYGSPVNAKGDRSTPNNYRMVIFRGVSTGWKTFFRSTSQGEIRWSAMDSDYFGGTGYAPTSTYRPTDFARTDDRAMEKIYDQVRGSSNLAVDFFEAGSTIRMIRNSLNVKKQMAEMLKVTTRTKKYKSLSKGQQRLDYVTKKWLEARYGWLPLVYSTYDALDNIGNRLSKGVHTITGRSGVTDIGVDRSGSGSYADPTVKMSFDMRYRTEIKCDFRMSGSRGISDWTSLNPIGIAWELLPLSFVADWFVNVSSVLSNWENWAVFANSFVGGYRTQSYREELLYSRSGTTSNPVPYWPNGTTIFDGVTFFSQQSYGYKELRLFKDRVRLDSLPMPAQGIRIKPKLNAKRLTDAAALLHVFTKDAGRRHGF